MNQTSISVVVPAYNAEKTIQQTLQALQSQTYKNLEIIVVDDGSKDTTGHIVKSFPKISYIYQDNAGPAAARNRGARAASSEIICFTDSDCVPQNDWIEKIMAGFHHESVGVVCGSYGIANPQSILARCIHKEILYRHDKLMSEYPKAFGSYNFAVRKKIFEEVNGFNTSYRNASGEDNDLSYKILKAGYKIFFQRSSLVDHFHTDNVVKYLKEQSRHGFWRVKMYQDHPQMMKGDDYTFWKDIIEPPTVYLLLLSAAASIFFMSAVKIFSIILISLITIEFIYGFVITKNIFDGIYWGLVMFARAFARTFGFSTGILFFAAKKI